MVCCCLQPEGEGDTAGAGYVDGAGPADGDGHSDGVMELQMEKVIKMEKEMKMTKEMYPSHPQFNLLLLQVHRLLWLGGRDSSNSRYIVSVICS